MPSSVGRILTSHAGSLPRPEDLIEANRQRAAGGFADEEGYQAEVGAAVTNVVARQRETGIDLVNDGEYGHSMGHRYDFGSWWTYVFQRLGGLELVDMSQLQAPLAEPKPGEVVHLPGLPRAHHLPGPRRGAGRH
jgi:5-methyltetrahydropteroyltriglutamate--homocysteine methyltransferase